MANNRSDHKLFSILPVNLTPALREKMHDVPRQRALFDPPVCLLLRYHLRTTLFLRNEWIQRGTGPGRWLHLIWFDFTSLYDACMQPIYAKKSILRGSLQQASTFLLSTSQYRTWKRMPSLSTISSSSRTWVTSANARGPQAEVPALL